MAFPAGMKAGPAQLAPASPPGAETAAELEKRFVLAGLKEPE